MKIGIDIDWTVIDPIIQEENSFLEHVVNHPTLDFDIDQLRIDLRNGGVSYNWDQYVKGHGDVLSFWKRSDVYDRWVPYVEANDVVNYLDNCGHEVVFVSNCFKNHVESKRNMISTFFGDYRLIDVGLDYDKEHPDLFDCSKDKPKGSLYGFDIMIDDRAKNLINIHAIPVYIHTVFHDEDYNHLQTDFQYANIGSLLFDEKFKKMVD